MPAADEVPEQPDAGHGLVRLKNELLTVTDIGKQFTRNICSAFDGKLQQQQLQRRANALAV